MSENGLILFFDVNGTIIASDEIQGKTADSKILQELAKKYVYLKEFESQAPITLRQFALNQVEKDEQEYRRYQGTGKLGQYRFLLSYLDRIQHPFYEVIKSEYLHLSSILATQSGLIFPAFYNLLAWLDRSEIPYVLVLRSFGQDIPAVIAEFEERGIVISRHGHFVGQTLHTDGRILTTPVDIMQELQFGRHHAWRDDYSHWRSNHFKRGFGKPFFVDDSWSKTLFFDDNALIKEILLPMNARREILDHNLLVNQGRIVAVNMLEALLDDAYFIKHVQEVYGAIGL